MAESSAPVLLGAEGVAGRADAVLRRLDDPRAGYLVELLFGHLPERPRVWWLFPLLTIGSVVLLALYVSGIWPAAALWWLFVCMANVIVQLVYRPHVKRFIPALHQLPRFLDVATALSELPIEEVATERQRLRDGVEELGALRRATWWLQYEPGQTSELAASVEVTGKRARGSAAGVRRYASHRRRRVGSARRGAAGCFPLSGRRRWMPRMIAVTAVLLAVGSTPTLAQLQPPEASRWSVQPSVGVLLDAYDMRADGSRAGALVGLQVARRISATAMHLTASLAYARVNDVGLHPPSGESYRVYRNEWVFAAAGPAVELPVRRAIVSLSLQGGAAWRRTPDVGLVGEPLIVDPDINSPPLPWLQRGSNDFSVTGVLVPGATVRIPLGRGVAAAAGASAYWSSFDEGGEVSPAFTLGLSWTP